MSINLIFIPLVYVDGIVIDSESLASYLGLNLLD